MTQAHTLTNNMTSITLSGKDFSIRVKYGQTLIFGDEIVENDRFVQTIGDITSSITIIKLEKDKFLVTSINTEFNILPVLIDARKWPV